MSKMTAEIERIKNMLDSISGLDGYAAELVQREISPVVDSVCEYIFSLNEDLSAVDMAEQTGYKCPICKKHKICMTPGLKPLCGETYDHFERDYSIK